jgi:hypothetical protein
MSGPFSTHDERVLILNIADNIRGDCSGLRLLKYKRVCIRMEVASTDILMLPSIPLSVRMSLRSILTHTGKVGPSDEELIRNEQQIESGEIRDVLSALL